MGLSRRAFLKGSGAAAGGAALALTPGELAAEPAAFPLHKRIGEIPTVCTYCAVGCGQIVAVQDGRVVNVASISGGQASTKPGPSAFGNSPWRQ